jgi:hypothetical protein
MQSSNRRCLIAVTEGKQKDFVAGFMQNVIYLDVTMRVREKESIDDEFDYLYRSSQVMNLENR